MNDKLVICLNCKCVHFPVSEAYVKAWEKQWEVYWPTLDKEGREMFGLPHGPPSRHQYLHCFFCDGSYKNFREAISDEIPFGSTIQPILDREE